MIRPHLYRSLRLRVLRLSGHVFRVAVPLCLVIPILAACHILVSDEEESCVQTHDEGCLSEPEFEALVQEIAGEYAEPSSFQNQWGLAAINADQAYANLELEFGPDVAPGEGVTVGVLDTGIDNAHPQFRNKTVPERFLAGATGDDGSELSHGTAVASIIAGEDIPGFPYDAQGVAWGADLVVFAIPLGEAPELYDPIQISELPGTAEYFADRFDEILAWRFGSRSVDLLNLSLGVSGIIENYSEEVLREPFARMIASIVQEGTEDKVVLVWAAGNSHGTACGIPIPQCVDGAVEASSIDLLPGLATHFPELQENTVAVVAIRPDGEIAEFSNRCGFAADYCVAAPGEEVRVSYFGPDGDGNPIRSVADGGGTSYAAPMVTGGLALMKQYFRGQISNTDLLSRLLETADRSGIYADGAIYGRGLMDLGAATSPVGAAVVAMGDRVESAGATLQSSGLQLGLAFGDAFVPVLEGQEIAAFDTQGAPFWYDVDSMVNVAARPALHDRYSDFQQLSLSELLGSPADAIRLPILETRGAPQDALPALYLAKSGGSPAASASHFALARHSVVASLPVAANLSATLLTTEGLARQEPASGAALTWREPEAPFGLRAGWLDERDTLLGSEADGAFGDLEAHAAFAGIEADTEVGSWRLGGTAEIGTVTAQAQGGVFQEISPLATSAFALHATRQNDDGSAFRVSLSQPLRVEGGQASITIPSGRTTAGEVIRNTLTADVEPGGRQVDLALQWQQPLEIGELRLGATLSHEPGHRRNADAELILLSGWRHFF
ncbi:MAG: S8 family serine peptidase [Rhodospirillaceae bacterium]|nr:S8 family serine peptidase [Rhodospirillaceae bacterium]